MKELNALVVDDSKVMRLMVMKTVRQAKLATFNFDEAEDGEDALNKFGDADYEILFVDINMPKMNGVEFVQKVRASKKKNADLPIVMVTSEKTMGKIEEALDQAGADAYICKPFTVQQLQQKLGSLIEKAGAEPAKASGGGFFSRRKYAT